MSILKKVKFASVLATSLSILALLSACQSTPDLSDMQKRQMTTRSFDGSYDNVFAATMTVVQDRQYVISQTVKDTGLITAESTQDDPSFKIFGSSFFSDNAGDTRSKVNQVSITVSKLNNKTSEIRILLQQKDMNRVGGVNASKQIYNADFYNKMFNDIGSEVKRREAMGRN